MGQKIELDVDQLVATIENQVRQLVADYVTAHINDIRNDLATELEKVTADLIEANKNLRQAVANLDGRVGDIEGL